MMMRYLLLFSILIISCVDQIVINSFKNPIELTEDDFLNVDLSAVLALRIINQSGKQQLCTATLISKKHVVTAASCFDAGIQYAELYSTANAQGVVSKTLSLTPVRIFIHPEYADQPFQKDIAIIEVKEDDPFLSLIKPMNLSQSIYSRLLGSKIYQVAHRVEESSLSTMDMGVDQMDMMILDMGSSDDTMPKTGDIIRLKLFETLTQMGDTLIIDDQVKELACLLNKATAVLSMEDQNAVLVGFLNQGNGACIDGVGIGYQEIDRLIKRLDQLEPKYTQENGTLPTQLTCKTAMFCQNFPCTQLVKTEDKMKFMTLSQCLRTAGCDKFDFNCAKDQCKMQYEACESMDSSVEQ